MAALGGCHIVPFYNDKVIFGFEVQLPIAARTVLIVDDNEDVLRLFQGYVCAHGFEVVTTQAANDARDKARRLQPYCIVLDLMMPDHDGWELLQVLLSDTETWMIPVLVCSVLKQKELALSLGAAAYLEKPVTAQILLSALDALGGHDCHIESDLQPPTDFSRRQSS